MFKSKKSITKLRFNIDIQDEDNSQINHQIILGLLLSSIFMSTFWIIYQSVFKDVLRISTITIPLLFTTSLNLLFIMIGILTVIKETSQNKKCIVWFRENIMTLILFIFFKNLYSDFKQAENIVWQSDSLLIKNFTPNSNSDRLDYTSTYYSMFFKLDKFFKLIYRIKDGSNIFFYLQIVNYLALLKILMIKIENQVFWTINSISSLAIISSLSNHFCKGEPLNIYLSISPMMIIITILFIYKLNSLISQLNILQRDEFGQILQIQAKFYVLYIFSLVGYIILLTACLILFELLILIQENDKYQNKSNINEYLFRFYSMIWSGTLLTLIGQSQYIGEYVIQTIFPPSYEEKYKGFKLCKTYQQQNMDCTSFLTDSSIEYDQIDQTITANKQI